LKVIVLTGAKGGVGKTTLALNMAYAFARQGKRTLLLDTDMQGGIALSLSRGLSQRGGWFEYATQEVNAQSLIVSTNQSLLHILPHGQVVFSELVAFERAMQSGHALQRLRDELGDLYDLCIVDLQTGLDLRAAGMIDKADFLIAPLAAEPLSARVVPHVLSFVSQCQKAGAPSLFLGFVLTMWQAADAQSTKVVQEIRTRFPESFLFYTIISHDEAFVDANELGMPVGMLRTPPPAVAMLFEQLCVEVERRMQMTTEEPNHEPRYLVDRS
tara:strand:- start:11995 stop:12807 length:813 start_codon:yes stop_codon:yes gene_type:complete